MDLGKLITALGVIFLIVGLLLTFKVPIPFLGKLPGDFSFKGENFHFYFPLATSLILSIILSLVLYILSKF